MKLGLVPLLSTCKELSNDIYFAMDNNLTKNGKGMNYRQAFVYQI